MISVLSVVKNLSVVKTPTFRKARGIKSVRFPRRRFDVIREILGSGWPHTHTQRRKIRVIREIRGTFSRMPEGLKA